MTAPLLWGPNRDPVGPFYLNRDLGISGDKLAALNDRVDGQLWERVAEAALAEEGRRLASQREDLIADGANPADLLVPLHPVKCLCDGGAYFSAEENATRHPFLIHPDCPLHGAKL